MFVFAGGAVGTALRWGVGVAAESVGLGSLGAIIAVNTAGSFGLGWFVVSDRALAHHVNGLIAVGLLGSFTTFSAFAVGAVELIDGGSPLGSFAFVAGSMALGYGAAVLGRSMGEPA